MQPLQHIAILLKVMSQNKSYTDMKRHDGVRKRLYKYTKEGGMYCNAMPLAVSLVEVMLDTQTRFTRI